MINDYESLRVQGMISMFIFKLSYIYFLFRYNAIAHLENYNTLLKEINGKTPSIHRLLDLILRQQFIPIDLQIKCSIYQIPKDFFL